VPIRWRHVCILFRRFQSFGRDVSDPYLRELEAREVPHLLVGGRSLHQREELETLRVALAAVEWPDDALSVYGTLRGDLFGLTDGQLLRFRARAGHLDPFRRRPEDPADDLSPVAEALDLLADLHRRRNDVPIAHTLHRLLETTRAHAGFALRHSGNQVLANVQRLADMARAFEVGGGLSFRGFVERLDAEAEHPTAKHTPALEEGAEGVRLMTVHAAKGLEFPVVLLADPTCNLGVREPWRTFDGERRLAATKILGCAPQELLEARDLELERDRAEAVRLTYVAATRARELLVVPAVGTGPWRGGWLEPLYGAVYPPSAAYRSAEPAPGCPAMGETTVLQPPRDPRVDVPIRPGLHRPKEGTHGVVWWDPALLRLKVAGKFGLIKERVLRPDPEGDADARGLDAYVDWLDRRDQAVEAGQVAGAEVATVTDFEQAPPEPAVEVTVEILDRPAGRPAGRRFGTLVHAILGDIDLDADTETVRALAHLHGRMASAPASEIDAAADAVDAALRHPLLQKAAKAEDLWRETPFQLVLDGGLRLEGTFDLAFGDGDTWTVVDFKTDAGLGEATHLDRYRRQVAWYAHALRELTGRPAEAVLLGV
ncbi:MAG: 3'-5' exonuclease, partial [Acidobacteriota bacterium]